MLATQNLAGVLQQLRKSIMAIIAALSTVMRLGVRKPSMKLTLFVADMTHASRNMVTIIVNAIATLSKICQVQ